MFSSVLRVPLRATSLLVLLALLPAMAPALLYFWGHGQKPLLATPNAGEARNFSVGFSLQSSYGAAVVIFEGRDGELEKHARVHHGSKEYRRVMANLSLESSQHLAYAPAMLCLISVRAVANISPLLDDGQYFADQPRRVMRNALKKLGLPASHKVAVLGGIKNLRSELESDFGIRISEAVFTSSHLVALYQDDLTDMADYVGIKYITPKSQFKPILWETAAAYAGYGLGVCKHWQDEDRCRREFDDIPQITLLAVHYSCNVLTVSLVPTRSALGTFEPDYRHVENFTLGSDSINEYPSPDDYWAGVKDTLLHTMREFPGFPKPDKIMMTGEVQESFIKFLRETHYEHSTTMTASSGCY